MRENIYCRINFFAACVREVDGVQNFFAGEVVAERAKTEIFPAEINRVRSVNQRGLQFLEIPRRCKQFGLNDIG